MALDTRLLALASLLSTPALALADEGAQLANLVPDAGISPFDFFGNSVAVDDGVVAVGNIGFDLPGLLDVGNCTLFDAVTGAELRTLVANNPNQGDGSGVGVAMDNGRVAVAANNTDNAGPSSGSVYVYDVATGNQLFELTASDAQQEDSFGTSIDVDGDLLVVGARFEDFGAPNSGAAYIFDLTTGTELHKLVPGDPGFNDFFGQRVAIRGNTVVVGSVNEDSVAVNAGAAYVFDAVTGNQLAKLTASDGEQSDSFGRSVAVDDNYIVVGASSGGDPGEFSGAAYVYDSTTFAELHKFVPANHGLSDSFGAACAADGGVAVIGAQTFNPDGVSASNGNAYVYDLATGTLLTELQGNDTNAGDQFGNTVAIDGEFIAVGAWFKDDGGTDLGGAAYSFDWSDSSWVDLGSALAGAGGDPLLEGDGPLVAGCTLDLHLSNAAPSAVLLYVIGIAEANMPAFGGTLVPNPNLFVLGLMTDPLGEHTLSNTVNMTPPSGLSLYAQAWIADMGGPLGFAASNGVRQDAP